jgi:hypothetical protein
MAQQPTQAGVFVQTTFDWEIQQLESMDVKSPEFKELLVRLYRNIGTMALVLNTKDTGQYALSEFINGQQYYSNPANTSQTETTPAWRQVHRKVISFGPLLVNGANPRNHNITCNALTTFTRIYATASDTTGLTYIPIPSLQATINVTSTQVIITTTALLSNYDVVYCVLEWITS